MILTFILLLLCFSWRTAFLESAVGLCWEYFSLECLFHEQIPRYVMQTTPTSVLLQAVKYFSCSGPSPLLRSWYKVYMVFRVYTSLTASYTAKRCSHCRWIAVSLCSFWLSSVIPQLVRSIDHFRLFFTVGIIEETLVVSCPFPQCSARLSSVQVGSVMITSPSLFHSWVDFVISSHLCFAMFLKLLPSFLKTKNSIRPGLQWPHFYQSRDCLAKHPL